MNPVAKTRFSKTTMRRLSPIRPRPSAAFPETALAGPARLRPIRLGEGGPA